MGATLARFEKTIPGFQHAQIFLVSNNFVLVSVPGVVGIRSMRREHTSDVHLGAVARPPTVKFLGDRRKPEYMKGKPHMGLMRTCDTLQQPGAKNQLGGRGSCEVPTLPAAPTCHQFHYI